MQRVYLAPYGVGLGHASRLLILAENIKSPGIEFRFSSFGEARNYIASQGFECEKVPPVEFMWGRDGEFSVISNINKIPQWLVNLPIQINKEIKYLKRFDPHIIISDSRLSPLIAARILNLPKILIINQVKLLLTPRLREFKAGRFFETCNGELMGGMWNMSDRILIPDLPPPYTISESTINSVKSIKSKLDYVGFITPRTKITENSVSKAKEILQIDSTKPLIFVHISGPMGTKDTNNNEAHSMFLRNSHPFNLYSPKENQTERWSPEKSLVICGILSGVPSKTKYFFFQMSLSCVEDTQPSHKPFNMESQLSPFLL